MPAGGRKCIGTPSSGDRPWLGAPTSIPGNTRAALWEVCPPCAQPDAMAEDPGETSGLDLAVSA